MIKLNLPAFELKLRGTKEHPQIFDILRRKYIALTPEEWVRQHFIHYLVEQERQRNPEPENAGKTDRRIIKKLWKRSPSGI